MFHFIRQRSEREDIRRMGEGGSTEGERESADSDRS
jgi:hypothetical protein